MVSLATVYSLAFNEGIMQIYIIFSSTLKTLVEGSLEVKLPTIWTDGKAEVGRVREEKRREEERRSEGDER